MKTLAELNESIDGTLYLPHCLPIYEYIMMPNIASQEFIDFKTKYIQNNGKKFKEFEDKLEPNIVYVVFKINNDMQHSFHFYPINTIKICTI
jgi:D-alanine-D-alanine ligase-like ATP-grasp enzyme